VWQRIGHFVTTPWWGTVWAVDRLLHVWAKSTNPKHAVAAYVFLNAGVTACAYYAFGSTNDVLTISGYVATLSGLLVGLGELYRARTLAVHLERVVLREIDRQRGRHYRFCLERAKMLHGVAQTTVAGKLWTVAVIRAGDLAEELVRIHAISPAADDRWRRAAQALRRFIRVFEGGRTGTRREYDVLEWTTLMVAVQGHLEDELAPFQYGGGEGHDPE